jgi:hypothetical protein
MNLFLTLLSVLLLASVVLIIRDWYVQFKLKKLTAHKYSALKPLIAKLSSPDPLHEHDVMAIAQLPALRLMLYGILESYGRTDIFPKEFYTKEKGAESYLVDWLEFPTELGRTPDEILFLKNVTLDLPMQLHYCVFLFRASTPRWASKLSWMLGVCGPYNDQSSPFDIPQKIFSRFNQADLVDPEAEVQWVHEQINV